MTGTRSSARPALLGVRVLRSLVPSDTRSAAATPGLLQPPTPVLTSFTLSGPPLARSQPPAGGPGRGVLGSALHRNDQLADHNAAVRGGLDLLQRALQRHREPSAAQGHVDVWHL